MTAVLLLARKLLDNPYVWLIAALLGLGAWYGHTRYSAGAATVQAAWDADTLARNALAAQQEADNRKLEQARQNRVIEAQNAQNKRDQSHQVAITGARSELDRLRNTIASIDARPSVPGSTCDADRQDASTARGLLAQCAAEYQGMADKAYGHYSDTLTLEQAWPGTSK